MRQGGSIEVAFKAVYARTSIVLYTVYTQEIGRLIEELHPAWCGHDGKDTLVLLA